MGGQKMGPTHFLLDIDGCLRKGAINELPGLEIVQHYMKRAREEKKLPLVSLCTGRGRGYGEAMHQNIGAPDTFSIFENGCFMERVTAKPRELVEHPKVKQNRERFAQVASFLASYAEEKGYYREPKEVMATISAGGTGKTPKELEDEIKAELKRQGWLGLVSVTHSTTAVDVTPEGVSKRTGVELFAEHLHLNVGELCGVGDSVADCEFLNLVGYAGCPSNAEEPVKEVIRDKRTKLGSDHGFEAPRRDIYGVVEILEYFNRSKELHLLETILPPLSMVQAIRDRATFMATRATKKRLPEQGVVCYEIDEDPHVATTLDQRELLESPIESATEGTLWRWPAGGALFVLKDRKGEYFCPLILRDEGARPDPNCFGTGAGLGASEDGFLFPNRVAVREAMEETVICMRQKIAYPFIRQDKWGGLNIAVEQIARKNQFLADKLGDYPVEDVVSVPATLLDLKTDTLCSTKWGNRSLEIPGLFVEDERSGAIDYVCAVEMDLGEHSADEIVLLDGEIQGTTPLWREMYLFELKAKSQSGHELGKVIKIFRKGRAIKKRRSATWEECKKEHNIGLTPGLKRILESLEL
jgi:HAD superfamily hydrolase (TIGR01484 family)